MYCVNIRLHTDVVTGPRELPQMWRTHPGYDKHSEPLSQRCTPHFSVYLSPWAVVTVRIKGHRLRFELLDDQMIFIQQRCGHLVGAPAVCPPAVPAGRVSCQPPWRALAVFKDATVLPVLHSDSRLSIQLCSSEAFSEQINDLSLQTQPTTQLVKGLWLIRQLVSY